MITKHVVQTRLSNMRDSLVHGSGMYSFIISDIAEIQEYIHAIEKRDEDNMAALRRAADEIDYLKLQVALFKKLDANQCKMIAVDRAKIADLERWNNNQVETIKKLRADIFTEENAAAWTDVMRLIFKLDNKRNDTGSKTNREVALELIEGWAKDSAILETLVEKVDAALEEACDAADDYVGSKNPPSPGELADQYGARNFR